MNIYIYSLIQFKEARELFQLNSNARSIATSHNQSPEFFLHKFLSSGMMEVLYTSNVTITPVLRIPFLEGHQQPKSEINKKVGKCKMHKFRLFSLERQSIQPEFVVVALEL